MKRFILFVVMLTIVVSLVPVTTAHAAGNDNGQCSCKVIYKIHKGDTLSGIARKYGISTKALQKCNHLKNRNHIRSGQKLCIPGQKTPTKDISKGNCNCKAKYTIKRGDTLRKIARKYGVSTRAIQKCNHIKNRNHIRAGQRICIPAKHQGKDISNGKCKCKDKYTIKWGDTLSGIAHKYSINAKWLQKCNHIKNRNRIYAGQRLCIPK